MKRLRSCFIPLLAAFICLSFGGCKTGDASGSRPKVLRFAYSPQMEQLEGSTLRIDLMRNYLQNQLHMPVEVVRVEGYAATIEAMRAEKVDVATFGGLGYIIAARKAGAEAIAARGNADGTVGGYRSVIAVPRNSPLHSMADLKAHANDLVFTFADPASTSGYLYPRVGLVSMGINPDKDFKKMIFAGGHPAAVMAVRSGKVDAGAFAQAMMIRLIELHKMEPGDVRILWTSELIPNSAIAVRKALPEPFKKELQATFIAIPAKDPELWKNWSKAFQGPSSGTTNVAVDDATYNSLRKYAAQVKDFNIAEN
jgi:phosphonate transport system substrate-binding protein